MNNEVENHGGSTETRTNEESKKGWRKVLRQTVSWMDKKDKDKWLDQMRENLSIIATIIATMTFQIGLNPPGGVKPVKDDGDQHSDNIVCSGAEHSLKLCPGEAVLAVVYPEDYSNFLFWNSMCFIASLSVLLFLVSGISLNHRFPMWILLIGTCLTLTYLGAIQMVTPDPVWNNSKEFQNKLIKTWIGFSFLLAFFLTLRIIIQGVKYFLQKKRKR